MENDMRCGVQITREWSDDDCYEFLIEVSDGRASFVNRTYVGIHHFTDTVHGLEVFKTHFNGGPFEFQFGEFGPKYANGACHIQFHYRKSGRLLIECRQEREFEEFGEREVASYATMYMRAEPGSLDRFVIELKGIANDVHGVAWLEGIL